MCFRLFRSSTLETQNTDISLRMAHMTFAIFVIGIVMILIGYTKAVLANELDTLNISIILPQDFFISDVVVASETSIDVGSKARLDGSLGTHLGGVILGVEAHVGTTVVGGNAQLKNRTQINGELRSAGEVTLGRESSVSGIIEDHATIIPKIISWNTDVPSTSAGDIALEPNELRDLQPGRYGNITLSPGSRLVVHSGSYAFTQLIMQPDSTVIVDDTEGAVQLHVDERLTFHGHIQPTFLGQSPQLVVVYHGTELVQIHTAFKGVFIATLADLQLKSGLKEGGHEAMFYGKQVLVQPNTIIRGNGFDWVDFTGDPDLVPDVTGDLPLHEAPASPADITAAISGDGTGASTAALSRWVQIVNGKGIVYACRCF